MRVGSRKFTQLDQLPDIMIHYEKILRSPIIAIDTIIARERDLVAFPRDNIAFPRDNITFPRVFSIVL